MSSKYVFTPKCKVQLSCFTDFAKHASAGALFIDNFLDFYTNKTKRHLQT